MTTKSGNRSIPSNCHSPGPPRVAPALPPRQGPAKVVVFVKVFHTGENVCGFITCWIFSWIFLFNLPEFSSVPQTKRYIFFFSSRKVKAPNLPPRQRACHCHRVRIFRKGGKNCGFVNYVLKNILKFSSVPKLKR